MNRERHLRTIVSRSFSFVLPVALGLAICAEARSQESQMRALAPDIVSEMQMKEQIEGIVINRAVTKQDGQPIKLTGFTTDTRKGQSGHRVLNNNQKLEFSVDDSSPQEVVITVTIAKSVLAGNPNDEIQTDYMSIGFVRGANSCWQECWKEGGQKICERVCYD